MCELLILSTRVGIIMHFRVAMETLTTRKTGMNVGKFGINVAIYGTKMRHFLEAFYDYNLDF